MKRVSVVILLVFGVTVAASALAAGPERTAGRTGGP